MLGSRGVIMFLRLGWVAGQVGGGGRVLYTLAELKQRPASRLWCCLRLVWCSALSSFSHPTS